MLLPDKIIKRCKKGDKKAQKILYDIFKSIVMGICRRYSSCKEEAEDIFQEAFIKIFQNIQKLQEADYLKRWIIRTTINTAINYYYKNRKHHGHLDVENSLVDRLDSTILDEISNEQLIACINKLPDGYRLIFNLHVIEGYSHNEIAELLNISVNTSKSQLSRAKALLRSRLEKLGVKKYEKYG